MMNWQVNRRAFTLIELLVVIAIIAILAAIIFPVFAAAKENARTAKCCANLGNIGRALAMYRDDNQGRNCHIWQHAWRSGAADDQGSFFFVIQKYAGQHVEYGSTGTGPAGAGNARRHTVYKCPSAPWLKGEWDVFGTRSNKGWAYTMNETGWNPSGVFAGGGLRDSDFRRPTQTIFVAESMGWAYGVGYGDGSLIDNEHPNGTLRSGDGWVSINPQPNEDIPLSDNRIGRHHGSFSKIYNIRVSHGGGATCLFYDNHIKLMKTTKGRNWAVIY